MTHRFKTALFAGSFRPFTIGHKSIVDRTLKICDKVVIAFGTNLEKDSDDRSECFERVRKYYEDDDHVEVMQYSGLTVDFAREIGADFMVRGVRNSMDFEYERNLAEINHRISGMETVFISALPELACVSSSMVRELQKYGRNVEDLII